MKRAIIISGIVGLLVAATPALATPQSADPGASKVTICHATGSETNPFVVIDVAMNSVYDKDGNWKAHGVHHNHGDVIPAPGDAAEDPELCFGSGG